MLEGREFGIPKKRQSAKVDPYEGRAVLIIKKAPENKGETYKFELSKQALVDLDLVKKDANDEKLVSFSFSDDVPVIGNTTSLKGKIDSSAQYNVSMSGIFSNKDMHDYLINLFEFDSSKDNELDIIIMEDELPVGQIMQLSVQKVDTIEEEFIDEVPAETINEEINTTIAEESTEQSFDENQAF